jgi:putative FmdB family regulatory protein
MPIYEYRCAACGFQCEYLRKVTDPSLAVCPECGKDTFKKLLTAAGFQLKGSGWYATDFKHSGAKPAEPKQDGDTKKNADAKPDANAKQDASAKPDASAKQGADAKQGGESKPAAGSKPAEAAPAAGGAGGSPAS